MELAETLHNIRRDQVQTPDTLDAILQNQEKTLNVH